MTRSLCWITALLLTGPAVQAQDIRLIDAFPHLRFSSPVFLTFSPDSSNRLFVVQQDGLIKVFANDPAGSRVDTFLDLRSKITPPTGEEGLLGMAFHPDFAANGFFYVNYTAPKAGAPIHKTVIERYRVVQGEPGHADPSSGVSILEFDQPFVNHNGGMLAFGGDGYLYIGTGDGGSANDPFNNGQNRAVLLGKILRIDVDHPAMPLAYGIPADNPFADSPGFHKEIWAYGLRNPWRFSFDTAVYRGRQALWVGDVGQDAIEEIDRVVRGGNYGWRIMEGKECRPGGGACDMTGLILPVAQYTHAFGEAVTGGYVYRGKSIPWLQGAYVYGDFGSGDIWVLRMQQDSVLSDSLMLSRAAGISSFGVDQQNELYLTDYNTGRILRFVQPSTGIGDKDRGVPASIELEQNYPNPFNPETFIGFTVAVRSVVELEVFDALGRRVTVLVDGTMNAGSHHVRFRGGGLPSGVYFYRLRAHSVGGPSSAGFEQTRRMTLIR